MTSIVPVDPRELAGDLQLTHHECRHWHQRAKTKAPKGQSQRTDMSMWRSTHRLPVSEKFKKGQWSLAQPTHLGWGGQDSNLEGPVGLKDFLFRVAVMEGKDCQSLDCLLRGFRPRYLKGRDRLNLFIKIYRCFCINYIDIFNFDTHFVFHLTEQDTGGKTFFMATWTTSPSFAYVSAALTIIDYSRAIFSHV